MPLATDTAEVLRRFGEHVRRGLSDGWVAAPLPQRAVFLLRDAVEDWVRATYPSAVLEREEADPSRTQLAVRIYSPPKIHRVVIRSAGARPDDPLLPHSWVLVVAEGPAAVGGHAFVAAAEFPMEAGGRFTLSLLRGPRSEEGCPLPCYER